MDDGKNYMLSIDQSTQGTKALLFNAKGDLIKRSDVPHRQIVDAQGWVEHDLEEIWENTKLAVQRVIDLAGIRGHELAGISICNQRETIAAWDRATGIPIYHAIVWQCSRGRMICSKLEAEGHGDMVRRHTGLTLSPYFSASKLAWIFQNVAGAGELTEKGQLCCGTMDSWLIFKLTQGKTFGTDPSNASRTQLLSLETLQWDDEVCRIFGIPVSCLPQIYDSDALYGMTDLDGLLECAIPICGVLGDSHGALFGQGCHRKGMAKATYGTGSSVMMNVGVKPIFSNHGLSTSVAWSRGGCTEYVLEGNINYTGAVITWLKDNLGLIENASETEQLAFQANPLDKTYIVPAFSGLGAPYWDSEVSGLITGLTRTAGKAEIAKAALECIAYQIADVVELMKQEMGDSEGCNMEGLRVDGGPTKNKYLMQFQSNLLDMLVEIPEYEELSGIGAAYLGGISLGMYEEEGLFQKQKRNHYSSVMPEHWRMEKLEGWKAAIERTRWRSLT